MVSDVLFQGYERGIPWCCFMVHSESMPADEINEKVRVYLLRREDPMRKRGDESRNQPQRLISHKLNIKIIC